MNHKKRGQVTIFIIIGIILLFSSALIFYIRNQISTIQQPTLQDIVENVPLSQDPVDTFVRDCLEEISIRGIQIAGEQGGYLDYEAAGLRYNPGNPTRSDLLRMSDNSDMYVPYWLSMPANDACTSDCYLEENIPLLTRVQGQDSLEAHLADYIKSEINVCLNNFEVFRQQGYEVTQAGEMDVDFTIAQSDISVKMTYPLSFQKEDSDSTYSEFNVRIPFDLRRAYALAEQIIALQKEKSMFEYQTMNLISAFSGRDENDLPPVYDIKFESGAYTTWQKSKVEDRIKTILMQHIPMMQVVGTRNYYRRQLTNSMMQGMVDKMIIWQNQSFAEFNLDFTYLGWWPIYLDVSPSQGEMIKPDTAAGGPIANFLPGFGIQQYRFAYDISYPVLVTITYPEAFFGRGYSLNFAIEANIRQNQALNGSQVVITGAGGGTYVCDPDNFNTDVVTINLTDYSTRSGMNGAQIYYNFGTEGCPLGVTGDSENSEGDMRSGILKTRMPSGIGFLLIEAEGYGTKSVPYAVRAGEGGQLDVVLYPKKSVSVTAKKLPNKPIVKIEDNLPKIEWTYDATPLDLSSKDQLMVSVNNVNDDSIGSVVMLGYNGTENPTIDLVPGNYTLEIQQFTHRDYIIPQYEDCYPSGFLGLGEECNDVGPMEMDVLANGGATLDTVTGYWQVTADDLYTYDNVQLYVVTSMMYDIPENQRRMDDLEQLDVADEIITAHRGDFEPTWS